MPRHGTTLKHFVGAPDPASLVWTAETLSLTLLPSFRRFLNDELIDENAQDDRNSFASRLPAWRVIPSPALSQTTVLEEFVRQSFEAITEIESSLATSSPDATSTINARLPSHRRLHIRRLSALPTAVTLAAQPRARSNAIDLLVAVLSVSVPRAVRVRRTGRFVNLVELSVADESGAQLQVTCWLGDETALRGTLASLCLRAGDVVLVTDVALGVFNGTVCAQSIGGRGRRQTDVVLLKRLYEKTGEDLKSVGGETKEQGESCNDTTMAANVEQVAARLPGLLAWAARCIAPPLSLSLSSSFMMRSGEELALDKVSHRMNGKRREEGVARHENVIGTAKKLRRRIDISDL